MKKLCSVLLAFLMVLSMASVAFAAPDMSGSVINVTAADAQDVLDGKFGSIDGKTINFTEDVTDVLVLARPTAYAGSNTTYVCENGNPHSGEEKTFTDAAEFSGHFDGSWHATPQYYRTVSNVTFTADEGVEVAGFSFAPGHNYQNGHDYVLDKDTQGGVHTCYEYLSIDKISFDGLTITGSANLNLYATNSSVSNITFDGCTFTGTSDGTKAAIQMGSDTLYFENVTVKNCTITDYFQGVYVSGVDGLTVSNNVIKNTDHNAIAIQSSHSNFAKGDVVVLENYIEGAGDRAIRVGDVESAEIVVNNNAMVDSGDGNELFKATSMGTGSINLENNYWDGNAADVAINSNGGVNNNVATGIVSGNFTVDVSDYLADGFVLNASGTVISIANPGKEIVVSTKYARADYKVKSYDFTTGTRDFKGASYIEEIKINKDNELVIVLKDNYKLAEDKAIKGEIVLQKKSDKTTVEIPVEYNVKNNVAEVYGSKKAADATDLNDFGGEKVFGDNCVIIMDEDGGYVTFTEEMLTGTVKMNKDEKTFLNLIYGGQEETVEAIEELLGEEYLEEAIIEYYEFETRAFKNEVDFSYEAYEDDPHYFYLYNDGKLTAIDVTYNDDEDVEAWQWTAIAEGTIIVTDVEIVLAEEETKNPDTGANDVVGIAAALAVTSLVAAAAISIKK